jgi:hypothetical protein
LVLSFPLTPLSYNHGEVLIKGQKNQSIIKAFGLKEEQKANVESIFNEQKKKLQAIHEENEPFCKKTFLCKNK